MVGDAAPIPVWSSNTVRVRLNRGGNRTINNALHMAAVTQVRRDRPGAAYYAKQLAAGKAGGVTQVRAAANHPGGAERGAGGVPAGVIVRGVPVGALLPDFAAGVVQAAAAHSASPGRPRSSRGGTFTASGL
ncbi:transposase [Streptomyces sp. NPDC055140]